jgi:hypothetical protein
LPAIGPVNPMQDSKESPAKVILARKFARAAFALMKNQDE